MKYKCYDQRLSLEDRKALNEKVLYLINVGKWAEYGITKEDIFNAYTGNGGLHGLRLQDFPNYAAYAKEKQRFELGQFFTPASICRLVSEALRFSKTDLIADLSCGKGSFFNFLPNEANIYGCELDYTVFKVAKFLFPEGNIEQGNLWAYTPNVYFDYVLGNPPWNCQVSTDEGTILSQLAYCIKASTVLKPLGIMALVVPASFLADDFSDAAMIREMESRYSFLGQIGLSPQTFADSGVENFSSKIQFWQKKSTAQSWKPRKYTTELLWTLPSDIDVTEEAQKIFEKIIMMPKAELEKNRARILLELAHLKSTSSTFVYETQKLLYHIKINPKTQNSYAKCCETLHRFYTEKKPDGMSDEGWQKKRLTERKVLAYLKTALRRQSAKPEREVIALVKRDGDFKYKAYSAKTRKQLAHSLNTAPTPIYDVVQQSAVPAEYYPFRRMIQRRKAEYEKQSEPFFSMAEDAKIAKFLDNFSLYDAEKQKSIYLEPLQKHDINLTLQKRYALLQWEQGCGKTLAGIATGLYRMKYQKIHSTWVVSSAISIRNNWCVTLPNYNLPFVFVERLCDLEKIKAGDFVLITLNKVCKYRKQIAKWVKIHKQNIQLVLDESDEISNGTSIRTKSSLSCFRRCHAKLLTTGTSLRNNISEFVPQLEMLYNNSINMLDECSQIYNYNRKTGEIETSSNEHYGMPYPPYKKGYSLFSACYLPEKATVFGVGEKTQDIYNAEALTKILDKTVITRTFEEITGREIRQFHQVPLKFAPAEADVYKTVIKEFYRIQRNYFSSTGNSKKDAMLRLVQQIALLLRVSAAPNTMKEYESDQTPVKIMRTVNMIKEWDNEIVAVGVRHKIVVDAFAEAFRKYLPDRPLFVVTGSTTTFAQRRALHNQLEASHNGILLCTQQSLPSSVNFEYINKVIIPELHYNNAAMSQFYMRFVRYTSTDPKDIYFLTYTDSLESNQFQMVLVKEKLHMFMKGKNADLDEIYERFGVDYNLLSLITTREKDDDGHFYIRWGEQKIS